MCIQTLLDTITTFVVRGIVRCTIVARQDKQKSVGPAATKDGIQKMDGDICICTIPLPVLSNINHNFSSDVSRAIDYVQYINTFYYHFIA